MDKKVYKPTYLMNKKNDTKKNKRFTLICD